jgi:esterase/lipase
MKFFSGFSLNGEKELFKEFLVDSKFSIAGFSYGAIKAFEYAISNESRVDRLILLSPAFFQNKSKVFIKTQLRYFKLNKEVYIKNFLENVAYPSNINLKKYLKEGDIKELEYLLKYKWEPQKLQELKRRGIVIEIFLGEKDKIIDSNRALEFFSPITTTYLLKNRGHILKD